MGNLGEELLSNIHESAPDPKTVPEAEGLYRYEVSSLENDRLRLENEQLSKSINLRSTFAERAFWLVVTCITLVFLVVIGAGVCQGEISDQVQIALITGMVIETISVLAIVMRNLFPGPPSK